VIQNFEKYGAKYEKRYDRLGGGSPSRMQTFEKYESRYDRLGGGSPLRMRKIMKSMNRGTTASAAAHTIPKQKSDEKCLG